MYNYILKLILLCIIAAPNLTFGNGITITGLNFTQNATTGGTVVFDLKWFNSWRVTTTPGNYDAAWVFVKFRVCRVDPSTPWTHGLVSTVTGDHIITCGTAADLLEPVKRDGSAVGVDAAPDNTGLTLRRVTANSVWATPASNNVTMKITNLPDNVAFPSIDVKIFGYEMVFVPGGAFSIGDNTSQYAFKGVSIPNENAWNLTSADFVSAPANATMTLPAAYPKGTLPFHCMKYEVTQGQYTEFLNTLSSVQQVNRFPGNIQNYRFTIQDNGVAPALYTVGHENRACNYLRPHDGLALLDWSGLRPMTELEFEKACRGSGAVTAGEYAWGSTSIVQLTSLSSTVPTEDGTEVPTGAAGANCHFGNPGGPALGGGAGTVTGGGNPALGPVRSGIFALSTTNTRAAAGATYYGIMEMSGNVWELVVPTSILCTTFTAKLGDGNLAVNGDHDTATWPTGVIPNPAGSGTHNYNLVLRGGSYWDAAIYQRTSDRWLVYNVWGFGQTTGSTRGVR